ncbi:PKD domain-containing protein [Candidatus Venteria ishoeyi]|uniref:PKD domain-containing protein n=1 Tax=Candidatus Venteria ishoeyi TaxID=1899563 RepID=UPI0025A575AC|nr:PKD domain-containing protein [Candidatus Venteria ishoeyi]MDM8547973.1 PKD domain-containing protein [Candidatus Venteria ishoeyi]
MRIKYSLLLFCLLLSPAVFALNTVPLVTFGNEAASYEGDDKFTQLIFLKVPAAIQQPLYVRIFDPDCGGAWDESAGPWNTRTRFSLFGGEGAYSDTSLHQHNPTSESLNRGSLLVTKEFGVDKFTDKHWYTLAEIQPQSGEKIGDFYYFKLLVQGLKGNDGNLFDVMLSTRNKQNHLPEQAKIFTFSPTASIPKKPFSRKMGYFAEFRFFVPAQTSSLEIHNFDLEHAQIEFETPYLSDFPLTPSGQGEWQKNSLVLAPEHSGQMAAVIIKTPPSLHNNLALYVNDQNQDVLPIELPIRLVRSNVRPVPLARTEFLSDCKSVVFDASPSTDANGRVLNYAWNFGDGESATGVRVIHPYQQPGSYQYQLNIQDDSGRIASRSQQSFPLLLNQPPIAQAGSNLVGAPGQDLLFDASASSDADGVIKNYFWDFDDGQRANGLLVKHRYPQAGLYTVRLRVEDDSSSPCNFDQASLEVWVNAPPVVNAGDNQHVAIDEVVALDGSNSFDSDGEISAYQWDFGDGTQQSGQQVEHQYGKPGVYSVRLTVTDNADVTNSQTQDKLTVVVNDPPQPHASVDAEIAATQQVLLFDGKQSTDSDGKISTWLWDFGDGQSGQGEQVKHAYAEPGTYVITLAVEDDSGTANKRTDTSFQVVINEPPVAKAGEDQHLTASQILFDGSASSDGDGKLIAWDWDFGDGQRGNGEKTQHVYAAPGTYNVVLTVTDDSGTSSKSRSDNLNVLINAKPIADAGVEHLIKPGESVRFDGRGSFDPDGEVQSWDWDFADYSEASTANGAEVSHTFDKPGLYRVQLKVTDNSGHAQALGFDETLVSVNYQPTARAGKDILTMPGAMVTFDGGLSSDPDGKLSHYQWIFSDEQGTAQQAKTRRSFEQAGIYSATLQVTDDSGAINASHSDSLTIYVNHAPVAQMNPDQHSCAHNLHFDASASTDADGDPLSYTWDFGDDSPAAHATQVNHSYAKGGKYPVTLWVDDGSRQANAKHQTSGQVHINRPPLAKISGPQQGCAGEVILFDATKSSDADGNKLKYLWSFGNQSTVEGISPVQSFDQGGLYPIKLTVEDDSGLSCNRDTTEMLIQIAEAPIAVAGPDQSVCTHSPVYFDGKQSRDTDGVVNAYAWNFGDGNTGGGAAPTHLYAMPGQYQVNLTITGDQYGHCANTHSDSLQVTVLAAPSAELSAPNHAPQNQVVTFSANPLKNDLETNNAVHIDRYLWDFGDGQQAEGAQTQHAYEKAGLYQVKLTLLNEQQDKCNQAEISHQLTINAAPIADAGADKQVMVHENVLFDASASYDPDGKLSKYQWDFGDGQVDSGIQIRHRYSKPGIYTARLIVKDNLELDNSHGSVTLKVEVKAPLQPQISTQKPVYCPDEVINFDGQVYAKNTDKLNWLWNFGYPQDSQQPDNQPQMAYQYPHPGTYTVSLAVHNASTGQQETMHRNQVINQTPTALIKVPGQRFCPDEKINFDGSVSYDPDGTITAYEWSFDNNELQNMAKLNYAFAESGIYTTQLQVTDDSGSICQSHSTQLKIYINTPPVAQMKLPEPPYYNGGAHDALLFDASTSSDADGDTLQYHWFFGDGQQGNGKQVFHAYSKPGKYNVRLQLIDSSGTSCNTQWLERVIQVEKH